jgi:hypothetical protein
VSLLATLIAILLGHPASVAVHRESCPLSEGGSTIGMTISGCRPIASDTGAKPDPRFWGAIDCERRAREMAGRVSGDPHPTAVGTAQGNETFRRLTVFDGDDIAGERCELGKNDLRDSPVVFYGDGDRRVTFASIRLPGNFDLETKRWQVVLQMKQTQPSDVGGWYPALSLDAYHGNWYLNQAGQGADDRGIVWQAPARRGVWTRFAFDVVYSTDASVGSVRVYADLNADEDFDDSGERSALMHMSTLAKETPGSAADGFRTGQPVPSHLRAGIYHDPAIGCPVPTGCSVELDNVQVLAP